MKKILVLGGTGAMGIYLTPQLLEMGYRVDVVALDTPTSTNQNLNYIKADAMDNSFLEKLLKNEYHAIVDFLTYYKPYETLTPRLSMLLENTQHYISLSSYRVYSGAEIPTKETSPRLLDISDDKEYLAAKNEEYSLYKAIGEDIITQSPYGNWTIVRPAITYSSFRFQLITLEADVLIHRMVNRKKILLPREAMAIHGTMSWAGDVAKMIARLVLNPKTYGEKYTVATAQNHTWQEIADYYTEIGGLTYETAPAEEYLNALFPNNKFALWQLKYDRMAERIMDNSKILNITGLKQSELMPLKKGLAMEFNRLDKNHKWPENAVNDRMDKYFLNR